MASSRALRGLDGVGTGLIVRLLGGGVAFDLRFRDGEKFHAAGIHEAFGPLPVRDADAGVDLMGRAGQGPEHPLGIGGAVGLPKTSPFTSTTVSQPMTTALGCWAETAKHLPRASSSTSRAGVGAVTALSSKSLTQTTKSEVYKLSSSRRRGLPDARIRSIVTSPSSRSRPRPSGYRPALPPVQRQRCRPARCRAEPPARRAGWYRLPAPD